MRFLADENFNGRVISGLVRRVPEIKIDIAQRVGLSGASDVEVLEWAACANAIVLTHDASTVPDFAYDRMRSGQPMPGVVVIPSHSVIGATIDDLVLLATCSLPGEWEGQVIYLPL